MKTRSELWQFLWRQRWLPLQHKKLIYKKLLSAGESPDAPFEKDFFGLCYRGNLSNSIEFNIYYYGAFEKPLLFFLRDTLLKLQDAGGNEAGAGQLFCDIGANIGQHSLFMSRFASRVHAFEPYGVVSAKLEQHMQLNKISNISLHDVGLSDKADELIFFAPSGRNQGIGSFDAGSISKGNTDVGKLSLVHGDDYFPAHQISPVALMKMDVEGFEKPALNGLRATLQHDRPILVCEISYGGELAFSSRGDFLNTLPPDYELFAFNTRHADGSKAKRRGSKAKRSGAFELLPLAGWRQSGQDDIVACPVEKTGLLPRCNR
ncbi:MAG TPA: FkbM family methyltransferase [Gammaproteobacteria bacterium]|nr:FkbM family methyltransferase [Gammaproteobacteria bacterium]HIF87776.1 FkbM family methyltransferase [Gammaproteobacteria bacterium]